MPPPADIAVVIAVRSVMIVSVPPAPARMDSLIARLAVEPV